MKMEQTKQNYFKKTPKTQTKNFKLFFSYLITLSSLLEKHKTKVDYQTNNLLKNKKIKLSNNFNFKNPEPPSTTTLSFAIIKFVNLE